MKNLKEKIIKLKKILKEDTIKGEINPFYSIKKLEG